jgi:hypothetical protein
MKSNVALVSLALAVIAVGGACEPRTDPKITRLAEFYVQRFADSMANDTLSDSAAVTLRKAEIDSVTAGWTPDDWNTFWYEVEQLRKR